MSHRVTLITSSLVATVAFFLGLTIAGPVTPASMAASPAVERTDAPARREAPAPTVGLVNFADVIGRVNAAVVNIDATSRGRRRQLPTWHPPLDPFNNQDHGTPRDQQKDPP